MTDSDVDQAEFPKGLSDLQFSQTNVCGSCLSAIEHPESVASVSLNDNPITDDCVANLIRFSELRYLWFENTRITDAAIHSLPLESLEILTLSSTEITDACVPVFARCRRLKLLDISGTNITLHGREALRNELPPGCTLK